MDERERQQTESIEIRIRGTASGYMAQAGFLEVVDQETSTAAQVLVSALKKSLKEWREYWKEPKEKAKAAHAILCQREAELVDRIEPVIKSVSAKVVTWTVAEREKAAAAAEARDKAEWEARRREEEAQKKVAAADTFEAAAEVIEAVESAPPPPAEVAAPRMDASQLRDHWVWEVENFEAIPRRYLTTDDRMISEEVTRMKDKTEIPGIRAINKPVLASQFKRRA